MTKEFGKEIEPLPNQIPVGCTLYREPSDCSTRAEHYIAWQKLIRSAQISGGFHFEVQYEPRYELGYWKDIVGMLKRTHADLSLHAPIKERDIASLDSQKRNEALEETKKAMNFAHKLNADLFVLHLTPQDDLKNRDAQLETGFESLSELTDYKNSNCYNFQTALEIIEFPKWPSSKGETIKVLKTAKSIDPKIGFVVDVAHYWHNLVSLNPKADKEVSYPDELRTYINCVDFMVPIRRFHFGGSYIQILPDGSQMHQTHGVPGAFEDEKGYFEAPPPDFNGIWMPIRPTLDVLKNYIMEKKDRRKDPADIILEIHEPNIKKQIKTAGSIGEMFK